MSRIHNQLCELLEIEAPIILAGMGGVSRADLVAAVSNAGGLGVLGATGFPPDDLRAEIAVVRSLTDRPFGVDLLLPARLPEGGSAAEFREEIPPEHRAYVEKLRSDFGVGEAPARGPERALTHDEVRRQIQVVAEERPAVFASGLGNTREVADLMHEAGITVLSLVGNVRNAVRMRDAGADVLVAQGHEAGGHTGRVGTMALVPQVVDAVAPTPVVAAGGIGDGRGLVAALALGAVGVWTGSAFITTIEANAPRWVKEKMLAATDEDTQVSRAYSGKTMRNLKNDLILRWEADGVDALGMPLQGLLMSDLLAAARAEGKTNLLSAPAGQITGMLRKIRPAAEVVAEMVAQAEALLEQLAGTRIGPAPL